MTERPQIGVIVAGTYQMALRRKPAVNVGVRFWYGAPLDPERPGRLLDRSWRWQALIDGDHLADDPYDVWTWCCGTPIPLAEYRYLIRRKKHSVEHAPEHPAANPRAPIDMLTAPLPF